MKKYLIGALSALALGVAGLSLAPAAPASPLQGALCEMVDIFSFGPMCEAYQACSEYPDAPACQSTPSSTEPTTRYTQP
jgi:hypothetical protein